MQPSHADESFRGLLLSYRGRAGLIQRDIALRAGVSARAVQSWESGITLPTATSLQALIQALLEADGLTAGQETAEARALWTAAERDARRMHTPFDEAWFAGLRAAHTARTAAGTPHALPTEPAAERRAGTPDRAQDWGEAPDTVDFVGRADELELLGRWVIEERCRLVAVLGFGGIGKTSLAARLAQLIAPDFERVYWRSLRNAPPVSEWLAGAIGFLSDHQLPPPPSESQRMTTLVQLLRAKRCLLVLDNSETLFEPGQHEGRYRPGMDGYSQLLQTVGQTSHLSCLVLTSREAPPELAVLGSGVHVMELHGLGTADARALLADKHLNGDTLTWVSLVDRYGGNGLALKIVAETIRQIYQGDLAAFLDDVIAGYGSVFGGIRRLLDAQAERLTPVERDVLTRLAVEREPVTLAELSTDMAPIVGRNTVVEAIEALRQRSIVERGERGGTFTLQSMVLEYMTDRLVEAVADEIERGQPVVLVQQPLIKAQSKDFVRRTQERLIGAPILQRVDMHQTEAGAEPRLRALLESWQGRPAVEQGYGPGNVVNLLRLLRGDLRGLDLSRLALKQVSLQGVEAQDASLSGTRLDGATLDEAFAYSTALALNVDGSLLAAGTPTGELRLWRTADRTLLLAAQGHASMVWGVTLSEDGRLVATAGDDGIVRLWEVASGQVRATLRGHTGGVRGVAFSADGDLVGSGGDDGTVRLWDAGSGKLRTIMQGHTGVVWAVALAGDGGLLASGGVDETVRLWEVASGQLLGTLRGHAGVVFGLALSQDGRLVASAGVDGTVRLWDTASGELKTALPAHEGGVRGVALSGDGQLVASGGGDSLVRLWDANSGELRATLPGHTGAVWCVALAGGGRLLASGSWDGTIRLWEVASGHLLGTLQGHTGVIQSVTLLGNGQLVGSGGVDGMVRLWDANTGEQRATLPGHTGAVRSVALAGNGRLVGSGGVDGTIRLWEVGNGQLLHTLQGHSGAVWCVALSEDGRLLASGGVDATVRLWEAATGRRLAALKGHTGAVWGVALSRDARLVASAGADETVRLWDAGNGEPRATMRGHTGVVWAVALSGNSELVASGGVDGLVRLWDANSGRVRTILQGHSGVILGVALSGDGRLAASGGVDGIVRLWDVGSRQLLASLHGHTGMVWCVALSQDGHLLASGGDDGTIRLWHARSGTCLRTLQSDRRYQRLDITGLTGVTEAQRAALLALGAIDQTPAPAAAPTVAG